MITDILLSTLELAIEAFHQGDYSQAKQLYQQVLQQAPQHPDALHLLGLLEAGQGDIPTATALIQQAIDSKPEPLFYRNLAHLLKQNQQYTAALGIYQQWSEQRY